MWIPIVATKAADGKYEKYSVGGFDNTPEAASIAGERLLRTAEIDAARLPCPTLEFVLYIAEIKYIAIALRAALVLKPVEELAKEQV